MAFPTVAEVAAGAAALLNDSAQSMFTTDVMLPYIRHAYQDMLLEVDLKQLSLDDVISNAIVVTAGATTLGASLPVDMIAPTKLEERARGSTDPFVEMTQKEWTDDYVPSESLRYWSLRNNIINFPGATTDRDVKLYYDTDLDAALNAASVIPLERAEQYLSHRSGELAAKYVLQDEIRAGFLSDDAKEALSKLMGTLVRRRQSLPARRKPFGARWRQRSRYW